MASYPTTAKMFSTKVDGVDLVQAAHINEIQDEVKAVEDQLIASKLATLSAAPIGNKVLTSVAGVPAWAAQDGWIPVSSTWTYASATTINVPSGAAAIYKVGQGIRVTANGVVLQAYIVGVADTLLTTAGDALTNHTFSAISYTNTPGTAIGFPVWFAWTPSSQTGWTDMPTGTYRFSVAEKTLFFLIDLSDSTSNASNATTAVLALPVAPARRFNGVNGFAVDNGITLTVATRWFVETNGSIYFYTNMSAGVWINSGIKRVRSNGFYEIG